MFGFLVSSEVWIERHKAGQEQQRLLDSHSGCCTYFERIGRADVVVAAAAAAVVVVVGVVAAAGNWSLEKRRLKVSGIEA